MAGSLWALAWLAALPGCSGDTGLWLPPILGDHMVLQAGKAIPLWGRDKAGTAIQVSLGGLQATTRADAQGRWRLSLPASICENIREENPDGQTALKLPWNRYNFARHHGVPPQTLCGTCAGEKQC